MVGLSAGPRRTFDYLALLGTTISVAAIIAGNLLEGGSLAGLLQLTAFVIVTGGTLGAVLLQTPLPDFRHAIGQLRMVLHPPVDRREAAIEQMVEWSRVVRRAGLLALEQPLAREQDTFMHRGLTLLVDGTEPEDIAQTLDIHGESLLAADLRAAQVYEAMGGYAPTIGILGAVLGLIQVMHNLSDPGALGEGIAVAFVATIYGVGLANLLFLPIANKLRAISLQQARCRDMVLAGLVMIADGDNPRAIRSRLEGYLG